MLLRGAARPTVHNMAVFKTLLLVIVVVIGLRFGGQVLNYLNSTTDRSSMNEKLQDLGRWIHSTVGIVAIAIVLILLVRLIVLVTNKSP